MYWLIEAFFWLLTFNKVKNMKLFILQEDGNPDCKLEIERFSNCEPNPAVIKIEYIDDAVSTNFQLSKSDIKCLLDELQEIYNECSPKSIEN